MYVWILRRVRFGFRNVRFNFTMYTVSVSKCMIPIYIYTKYIRILQIVHLGFGVCICFIVVVRNWTFCFNTEYYRKNECVICFIFIVRNWTFCWITEHYCNNRSVICFVFIVRNLTFCFNTESYCKNGSVICFIVIVRNRTFCFNTEYYCKNGSVICFSFYSEKLNVLFQYRILL